MRRFENNPIITRQDIPNIPPGINDVSSVFNPGAIKHEGSTVLMLRVQNRARETFFITARSTDGTRFEVSNEPVRMRGIEKVKSRIHHCYDARITRIEGAYHIMFAMDMDSECRLGLARTRDFETFDFLGMASDDDQRNGVLFPEKIDGKYLRLDRPNRVSLTDGPSTGDAICISESDDLLTWVHKGPVISGRYHYWDELIGAGPPPIKTREGWLQIYHGIATHLQSALIYQAGVMLLDLEDPSKVSARGKYNILEPRELYELTGQVPNVVFPSGAVVDKVDQEGFADASAKLFLYYGAADTCVCLAFSSIKELIRAARSE